jgi:hypothetical protein
MDQATFTIMFESFNGISIGLSLCVLFFLCRYSHWNTFEPQLLLLLHICLIFDEICIFPYIYKQNDSLCLVAQFLEAYFDLMFYTLITILVIYHWGSMFSDHYLYLRKINYYRYALLIIFLLPLLSCLLYFTNGFSLENDNPWCIMPYHMKNSWSIFLHYSCIWMLLSICCSIFGWSMIAVCRASLTVTTSETTLLNTFFNTIGWYCLLGIVLSVLRVILRFTNFHNTSSYQKHYFSYFPVAISGLIFSIVFFGKEWQTLLSYRHQREDDDDDDCSSFTWEDRDVKELFEELNAIESASETEENNLLRNSILSPSLSPQHKFVSNH